MKTTPSQHQPLPIPEEWQQAERRFAARLSTLLHILFQRVSRLETRLQKLEETQHHE